MNNEYNDFQRRYEEALTEIEHKMPPALNIYQENCETLLRLTDRELAIVVRATLEYFTAGVIPEELLQAEYRTEYLIFESVRSGLDRSVETYRAQQRQRTLAGFTKAAQQKGVQFP